MSKETHRVKSHIWRNGVLTVFEEFFDSMEQALHYSRTIPAQSVKIYSSNGDLVHHDAKQPATNETYA
jgi:hypothetical protein